MIGKNRIMEVVFVKDITDGHLQIANLVRVEEVRLSQIRCSEKRRPVDSFALLLSGQMEYRMNDGRSYALGAGDIHYLPLHCGYTLTVPPEGAHYIVCDFVCTSPGPRQGMYFQGKNPQIYEKLFRELNQRFASAAPERMAASMAVLFQIYAQLVRDHQPSYISGSAKQKILDIQAHILQNLATSELSVKALAEAAGMSQVHFRRLFHAQFGISPAKYIATARVAKAKSLLGLSEMQLEDIAAQTGFASVSYFCSVFKAATGLTPSQYRSQMTDSL